MNIKSLAHRYLPKPIVSALKSARSLSYKVDPNIAILKKKFENANIDSQDSRIFMRDRISFLVHPRSREAFEWFCFHSPSMVKEYDLFVKMAESRVRFLDVGCSHGVFSLSMCALSDKASAVSVDPSPAAQFHLQENIKLNGFEDRITPVVCAAGGVAGTVSVIENWDHLEVSTKDTGYQVETRTIDSICASLEFEPDLIKIDVEGFELDALEGAAQTLKIGVPLFLEVHPLLMRELQRDPLDVFNIINENSYIIYDCASGKVLNKKEFSKRHHTFFTLCISKNLDIDMDFLFNDFVK